MLLLATHYTLLLNFKLFTGCQLVYFIGFIFEILHVLFAFWYESFLLCQRIGYNDNDDGKK